MHISKRRNTGAAKSVTGRTGDKWRQKTSLISKKVRLKREPSEQTDDGDGSESPSLPEARSTSPLANLPVPIRIQVIHYDVTNPANDSLSVRPHTVYYILATRKDESEMLSILCICTAVVLLRLVTLTPCCVHRACI